MTISGPTVQAYGQQAGRTMRTALTVIEECKRLAGMLNSRASSKLQRAIGIASNRKRHGPIRGPMLMAQQYIEGFMLGLGARSASERDELCCLARQCLRLPDAHVMALLAGFETGEAIRLRQVPPTASKLSDEDWHQKMLALKNTIDLAVEGGRHDT